MTERGKGKGSSQFSVLSSQFLVLKFADRGEDCSLWLHLGRCSYILDT
jgi:hypothetical protein